MKNDNAQKRPEYLGTKEKGASKWFKIDKKMYLACLKMSEE